MNNKLRSLVAAAVAGSFMVGFGTNAMADSTTDIVNALVSKGVLTEEEGALLTKGRELESSSQAKAMKKAGKVTMSDAIESATVYGDIRVRHEERKGSGIAANSGATPTEDYDRNRNRYKLTLGVTTKSGDWYTDLALAMGANGRSDNATFGKSATGGNINDKETLFVKTAMVGYKATDWLTLEAGRMKNPLYTTPMVWDADLTVEGLSEQVKLKAGSADVFLTAVQAQYQGDKKIYNNATADSITSALYAFQAGAKLPVTDNVSAKAALTYSVIGGNTARHKDFSPGTGTMGLGSTSPLVQGTQTYGYGVNNLQTIEIPAEVNFMASSNVGVRVFGDYVNNLDGDARAKGACAVSKNPIICSKGTNDDSAWLLGLAVGSAKDLKTFESNKMAKGDWSARIWYQDVGAYSVDANAVDSDFMDSRVNMKGTIFKAQYNIQDNVFVNFAAGHANRKEKALGAGGAAGDIALNLKDYDLYQLDLTYKF